MWFLSSVSNPEVQSGAVITVTITTHSLNVDGEFCGSRTLCVSMATTRADRFVNGNFLSKRKSWRALNPTKNVDSKNRSFKTEWTDKYAFVLPVGSTKPMCLIGPCQKW